MAKIEKWIIDKILDTADIVEVIGDFVTLRKTGVRYTGICPFHDDRHDGNFIVHPVKQCYKCFKCEAKGGVVDFLMKHAKLSYPDAIRYLGKKYNIETDNMDINFTPPPPRPKPAPLPMLVLPKYIMAATLMKESIDSDTLIQWIRSIHWDETQRRRIDEVLTYYAVGHSTKNGMTIFWQMDDQGRLRTGKMMRYKEDGHRMKDKGYNRDWIHSALRRKRFDTNPWPHPNIFNPDKQEMKPCLFGLHLLNKFRSKGVEQTVCLVESEKTAILMAIAYGNHAKQVWMATGGMSYISREMLQPLIDQRRRIILYPDRDGIDQWRMKCEQLHYDRATIDTTPVTKWWKPEDGDKADIADVVIRRINESQPMKTIADVKRDMPQSSGLIDKLNLEIEDND